MPQVPDDGDPPILELDGLCRAYSGRIVVDHVDLVLRRGEILGFLGPNGAGKTTTIRMALNLVRPSAGAVRVLGHDVWREPRRVLPRVGALVDAPALYPNLTGYDNLRAFAAAVGGGLTATVPRLLEVVGLTERQHERVRTYSLGMKQRLGVAIALLNDPDLLVLDEPANGLDPLGIAEMRDLMARLAADGRAIFLCSHVLREVETICTRVAIVDRGRLVHEGSVDEVLAGTGEFWLRVRDPAEVLTLLRAQEWGSTARLSDGRLVTPSPTGEGRDLCAFLAAAGHPPDALDRFRHDLEEVYLRVTNVAEDDR
ncbi:MAG TPA: ABC transporter ATP-binding protein, partial [Terriglobales bacterium]|nr:ABC transporter ATP-binding protein [Terriglobales bacterium]